MFFEMDKGDDAKVVSFGEIIHSCNKGEAVARECRHLHGGEGEGEVKTAAAAGEAAAAAGATTVAFGRNHDSSAQKQQQQQQEAPFVCVVVGDSVGDCAMGDSLQPVGGEEGCLRIGYLNHDDASHGRREHYIKAGFDLLIVGDGPLNAVSAIIRGLGGEEELLEVLVGAAEEL